jgi:hypothetical protein
METRHAASQRGYCGGCLETVILARPCQTPTCHGGYCGLCAPAMCSDVCPSCNSPKLLEGPRHRAPAHACPLPGCTAVYHGRDDTAIEEHVRTCPHRLAVLCPGVTVKDLPVHLAECKLCGDGHVRLLLQDKETADERVFALQYTLAWREDDLADMHDRMHLYQSAYDRECAAHAATRCLLP